jgi:hypothetical protein
MTAAVRCCFVALGCLALVTAGCSNGPGDVKGTFVDSYWLDSGTKVDVVPPGAAIRALVLDASGAYKEYRGTVAPDGSFTIPGVPSGTFFLEVRGGTGAPALGERTERSGLDAGRDFVGRADVVAAAAPTTLRVNVTGLDAWQTTDSMALLSSGANLATATGGAVLSQGDTLGLVQYGLIGRNLPQTVDTVHVYQLGTKTVSGPGSLRVATKAGSFTGVAVPDGLPTDVDVPLSAAPQTGSLAVDWKTSQFEAYRAQMAPAGATFNHELAVEVVPHSTAPMPTLSTSASQAATLLQLSMADGTTDQALGSLSYGQFLPAFWKELRRARYMGMFLVTAPGAAAPVGFYASMLVRDPQPVTGAVVPRVSPPRDPKVNGLDAFQPQAGVGFSPTFTWSAPDLGAPTDYVLNLMSVKASGSSTVAASVYTMRVLGTEAAVPSGVLQTGTSYVALLMARLRPAVVAAAPRRAALPDASAAAVLAPFTP